MEFDGLPERIRNRVDRTGDCWVWTGARTGANYGVTRWEGSLQGVHRVIYMTLVGPIPAGLHLDHLCRNTGCVNPDHLEPVTVKENNRRGILAQVNRDRAAKQTHCKQGHEYTPENTRLVHKIGRSGNPIQQRACKSCEHIAYLKRRGDKWKTRYQSKWTKALGTDSVPESCGRPRPVTSTGER